MPGRELYRTFNSIPTARTDFPTELDQNHPAVTHDDPIGILVQGYGKLLKVDFHDSACDSHFGTNEQVDGPVRRDRYLD